MIELYRTLYETEWLRRADIRQATTLPSGVLTLLAGVVVFLAREYSFPQGWVSYLFALALIGAVAAWITAVYMLLRALFGPPYKRIPWPSEIRDYEEKLTEHYGNELGGPDASKKEFENFLIDRYVDAANRNSQNNANAGEYVYKANRAVVASIIMVVVCAVPVIVDLRAQAARERIAAPQLQGVLNGREQRATQQPATQERDQAPRDTAVSAEAQARSTIEY